MPMTDDATPDEPRRKRRSERTLIFLLGADATDEEFEAAARALNEARGLPHPPSTRDTRSGEADA